MFVFVFPVQNYRIRWRVKWPVPWTCHYLASNQLIKFCHAVFRLLHTFYLIDKRKLMEQLVWIWMFEHTKKVKRKEVGSVLRQPKEGVDKNKGLLLFINRNQSSFAGDIFRPVWTRQIACKPFENVCEYFSFFFSFSSFSLILFSFPFLFSCVFVCCYVKWEIMI